MPSSKQPLIVEVTRGAVVESYHQVNVVAVNETGSILNYWGNPLFLTYPRSSIKMLQALPFIESGAVDHFGLEDKHIALACASHRGEREHLQALKEWAAKVPFEESQLLCGPHLPYHEASAEDFIRQKLKPSPFYNNCAGKHAAIISTCLHLGESPQGYNKYEHSAQKRLREILSETMKVDHAKVSNASDGCGILTYAVPLQAMAVGMAVFVNSRENVNRKVAVQRILNAIRGNAFYFSGSENFASAIIEKTQGRAIVKGGAEGVFCGVIPERKVAFAVKASDGAGRAAQVATAATLLHFGGLTPQEFVTIENYAQPPVTNWKGERVGQIRIAKG
jgi:L-asparaginase II